MLGTVVDTTDLLETVAASLVAGVGITTCFSLVILGAARTATHAREERMVLTVVTGLLTTLALVLTIAGIALGLVVMTSK